MRVVVTGGAGFIGSHIVDQLIARGCDVDVIDVFHPWAHEREPDYVSPSARLHKLDLRDLNGLKAIVSGAHAVCHQAAIVGLGSTFSDVTEFAGVNDLGTANLLRALFETSFYGRLVLASSMVVYGDGSYLCGADGPVRPGPRSRRDLEKKRFEPRCPKCGGSLDPVPVSEDTTTEPGSVYAATKLHQEHLCSVFGNEIDVPVTILRYHNVYGSRMPEDSPYSGVAAIFRSALEAGRSPKVFEDGLQIRDFIHVDDVARANVLALLNDEPSVGTYNIATGTPRTIGEMATALSAAFGQHAPGPVTTGEYRMGDVRHVFGSPDRAAESLGFRAIVGFEEGMGRFATEALRRRRITIG